MKIQFNPNLDFQIEAINSIVEIFDGQETCQSNFTVAPLRVDTQRDLEFNKNDLSVGNHLRLIPITKKAPAADEYRRGFV